MGKNKCECGNIKFTKSKMCPDCLSNREIERDLVYQIYEIQLLNEFVMRVNSRNGWVSLEELFIDLIDLFQLFGNFFWIDRMDTKDQLKFMWIYLQKVNDKLLKSNIPTFNQKYDPKKYTEDYLNNYDKDKISKKIGIKYDKEQIKKDRSNEYYEKHKEEIKIRQKEYYQKRKLEDI